MLFVYSIISKINFVFSMEGRLLFTSHLVLFLSMFIFISVSYCEDYRDQFAQCSRPFECGIFTNISHPFWGAKRPNYCGLPSFKLDCIDNQYPVIQIKNLKFRVLNINQSQYTMTLARLDLWDDICFPNVDIETTILNYTLFRYLPSVENLIFTYSCQKLPPVELTSSINNFTCTSHGGNTETVYYFLNSSSLINLTRQFTECRNIKVPIFRNSLEKNDDVGGMDKVREALNQGFEVAYDFYKGSCVACERSGGRCGFDFSAYQFLCYCHDTPPDLVCLQHDENPSVWNHKVVIGAITIAGVVISLTCVVICCFRSMKSSITFWSRMRKSDKHLEGLIKSYGHLSVKRYRFSDIKKITKSFEEKLGQGGYGGVYKGKLPDGNLVAVKVLNTSKGNGEEFVNEVASISRTSHINIVTLLGFCLEGTKRALVYEFMPNGSLEKFIYNDNPMKINSHLEREKLLEIATGIARGLEYLHRGCNTRILHFDIKPHNILLDEDFCPKISDFGLSKVLCERKESIISMMDARGTIGYIAPEVFNRNFGGVSHKSDVYSYGMMILEMVGGRENIKVGVTHTSQIYFPHWIYKHMELGSNLGLHGVVKAEEDEIARKMVLVGLWCIQTNPSDRPSMRKVIEMLEGSLEALQIPPKPFLSSPKSPEESYSTTSLL